VAWRSECARRRRHPPQPARGRRVRSGGGTGARARHSGPQLRHATWRVLGAPGVAKRDRLTAVGAAPIGQCSLRSATSHYSYDSTHTVKFATTIIVNHVTQFTTAHTVTVSQPETVYDGA
jgi:hypothetical protein